MWFLIAAFCTNNDAKVACVTMNPKKLFATYEDCRPARLAVVEVFAKGPRVVWFRVDCVDLAIS